jgi:hypothetical protein
MEKNEIPFVVSVLAQKIGSAMRAKLSGQIGKPIVLALSLILCRVAACVENLLHPILHPRIASLVL